MPAASLTAQSQIRVVVTFFLLLGGFNGIYQYEKRVSGSYVDLPYTRLVTDGSALLGNLILPFPVEQRGDITLGSGHTAVVVRSGCNGIEAIFLLLAGILAFPASWRGRLFALALYLPFLYALNLFRVLLLLYVMVEYPTHIDFFHYQIAQGFMVIFVLICWVHHIHRIQTAR